MKICKSSHVLPTCVMEKKDLRVFSLEVVNVIQSKVFDFTDKTIWNFRNYINTFRITEPHH